RQNERRALLPRVGVSRDRAARLGDAVVDGRDLRAPVRVARVVVWVVRVRLDRSLPARRRSATSDHPGVVSARAPRRARPRPAPFSGARTPRAEHAPHLRAFVVAREPRRTRPVLRGPAARRRRRTELRARAPQKRERGARSAGPLSRRTALASPRRAEIDEGA